MAPTLPARAGIGLRMPHAAGLLSGDFSAPPPAFVEVHAENYMVAGGPLPRQLDQVRARWPLALHGVGLGLAGASAPEVAHLDRLAALIARYQPSVFSEHLAWGGHGGHYLGDLLPVAYDRPTLDRLCRHIDQVQTRLGRRLLLENPSTYLAFEASQFTEPAFLRELVRRTGCGLLLDLNNLHVSSVNLGFSALAALDDWPLEAVEQIHLAGFTRAADVTPGVLLLDTHASPVDDAVWGLLAEVVARRGAVPTLIEWDQDLPPLDRLLAEAAQADRLLAGSPRPALPLVRDPRPARPAQEVA
ncbi:MNIO family bufferin maturase [Ideonella livida]|nr:DUF692 domain-containing protein [Ideonella livida]